MTGRADLDAVLAAIDDQAHDWRDKGRRFELLIEQAFKDDPRFADVRKPVPDKHYDLVVRRVSNGNMIAVECKHWKRYDPDSKSARKQWDRYRQAIDTFLAATDRPDEFDERTFVYTTAARLPRWQLERMAAASIPCKAVGRDDLAKMQVDWWECAERSGAAMRNARAQSISSASAAAHRPASDPVLSDEALPAGSRWEAAAFRPSPLGWSWTICIFLWLMMVSYAVGSGDPGGTFFLFGLGFIVLAFALHRRRERLARGVAPRAGRRKPPMLVVVAMAMLAVAWGCVGNRSSPEAAPSISTATGEDAVPAASAAPTPTAASASDRAAETTEASSTAASEPAALLPETTEPLGTLPPVTVAPSAPTTTRSSVAAMDETAVALLTRALAHLDRVYEMERSGGVVCYGDIACEQSLGNNWMGVGTDIDFGCYGYHADTPGHVEINLRGSRLCGRAPESVPPPSSATADLHWVRLRTRSGSGSTFCVVKVRDATAPGSEHVGWMAVHALDSKTYDTSAHCGAVSNDAAPAASCVHGPNGADRPGRCWTTPEPGESGGYPGGT